MDINWEVRDPKTKPPFIREVPNAVADRIKLREADVGDEVNLHLLRDRKTYDVPVRVTEIDGESMKGVVARANKLSPRDGRLAANAEVKFERKNIFATTGAPSLD